MRLAPYVLISAVCLCPVWGQIAQSNPHYCGIPGDINPPLPDVSATIDPTDGHAVLYLGQGSSATAVPLPGYWISEIEVCPLFDGRMVVFGEQGTGTAIYIVDKAKASVVDSFRGFHPAISPDKRWMVFGKFYPRYTEGPRTDEYLIYDFTKSAAQNRPDGNVKNPVDVGRAIFPPGQKNVPGDNVWVPANQVHVGGSRFYWAADSRAILFEDGVVGPTNIVLVTLDDRGAPTAFERPITVSDVCGREIPGVDLDWRMERAEVGPGRAGDRPIVIDIGHSSDRRCPTHALQLHQEDFQPAKAEVHVIPKPTKKAVLDDPLDTPFK